MRRSGHVRRIPCCSEMFEASGALGKRPTRTRRVCSPLRMPQITRRSSASGSFAVRSAAVSTSICGGTSGGSSMSVVDASSTPFGALSSTADEEAGSRRATAWPNELSAGGRRVGRQRCPRSRRTGGRLARRSGILGLSGNSRRRPLWRTVESARAKRVLERLGERERRLDSIGRVVGKRPAEEFARGQGRRDRCQRGGRVAPVPRCAGPTASRKRAPPG